MSKESATYIGAGVDISAGELAVEKIKSYVESTSTPGVIGEIGGFGGAFSFPSNDYIDPVLISTTDGVGTKAKVAAATERLDSIGIDLVAMCVDDLVCVGAKPLFMLDYIAVGKVRPEEMADLVSGIASGCRRAGVALIGGEMAEHAGEMKDGHFDIAGFATGVVERDRMLGKDKVIGNEVLIGLESPGLRSNGYSLARQVILERAGMDYNDEIWPGASKSVADALLEPSRIYAPAIVSLLDDLPESVHSIAHVTGGGLISNLSRVIPNGMKMVIDEQSWEVPRIFSEIQRMGNVTEEEMRMVFNMGIGMVIVCNNSNSQDLIEHLNGSGVPSTIIGKLQT